MLATNNPCNSTTQNCLVNPNNGSTTCYCKDGFQSNDNNSSCTGRRDGQKPFDGDKPIDFCVQILMNAQKTSAGAIRRVRLVVILLVTIPVVVNLVIRLEKLFRYEEVSSIDGLFSCVVFRSYLSGYRRMCHG